MLNRGLSFDVIKMPRNSHAAEKMLLLIGKLIKMRGMRQFTALLLLFVFSFVGVGQTSKPQTQNTKKVTPKNQNAKAKTSTKPKTLSKVNKDKTSTKASSKVKSAPKLTLIEATTGDGKAVTLKSNGTWEYVKAEPSPKPTPKQSQTPKEKPVAESKPTSNPVVKPIPEEKPKIAAKTKPSPLPKQCDLTLSNAPAIRGLKLGMPRSDADKLIPLDRVTMLDSSDILAYPKPGSAIGFENVSAVSARFVEDKLHALEIAYTENAVKWKNAKEFADNLSANLKLPAAFWKHNAKNQALSEMQCREFSIKINSELNEISLEKSSSPAKVEQAKETVKQAFKP